MSEHKTQVKRSGEGVIGTCSCRQRQMQPVETRQLAEDWILHHLDQVKRAQAHTAATPGLAKLRDQYLANARDKGHPKSERAGWLQLADELAVRVGRTDDWVDVEKLAESLGVRLTPPPPPTEQLNLF